MTATWRIYKMDVPSDVYWVVTDGRDLPAGLHSRELFRLVGTLPGTIDAVREMVSLEAKDVLDRICSDGFTTLRDKELQPGWRRPKVA